MTNKKIGIGICGSFCTFSKILPIIRDLAQDNQVTAVLSDAARSTDTRFYRAEDFVRDVTEATGREAITTIAQAEQVGPQKMFDVFMIAPCTGNTMAKLARGITDTSVTMAAKAHLRCDRPLLIALASNDAMSQNLPNLSRLLERKSVYFVPMKQDDPEHKPHSLIADLSRVGECLEAALIGRQLRPIFL
jgi:dipicolinate synthase subunit B